MSKIDIKPYKNQVYEELKYKCLNSGSLFIDTEFPPQTSSLTKFKPAPSDLVWKRPKDIVYNPKFFVDGAHPNDIDQGNCWFIAGAIAVAAYPELLEKVVPQEQSFSDNYCGIFHFRFWKNGEWLDVVIDDFLPVNSNNQLIYCRNKECKDEFWSPLLEKAYAKLATCYEFLDGGFTQDSMMDMTGGVNEHINLTEIMLNTKEVNDLWKLLNKAFVMKSLISACIYGDGTQSIQYNGLINSHAYSVVKMLEFTPKNSSKLVRIVQIKNPWKNEIEWNGRFSDFSGEWANAPDSILDQIGKLRYDDGEFWMPFKEFLEQFSSLNIVHVDMNAFFSPETLNRKKFKWNSKSFHGEWIAGVNSGGFLDSYYKNPQYLINIKDVDLDDNDDKATLIVSLMQKESIERRELKEGKVNEMPINFKVFKLLYDKSIYNNINQGFYKFESYDLEEVDDSGPYIAYRVISKRCKLCPGNYVIIPSTYQSNVNLKFLLRFYTEFEIHESYKSDSINDDKASYNYDDFDKTLDNYDNYLDEKTDYNYELNVDSIYLEKKF